ncbi:MAG: heme ABC transporter ATP-binding protein [Candidatus Epulonipiscioides saccharophilum]|nr:MAG: heme ABC transporter ATP-binding protein [Epulopiscium sp. AS2M-Bin001]
MKKAIIQFSNFTFQYKGQKKPTLNNIDLTIYEGEKVLIVGPSGSGKSTISYCINGLAPHFYKGHFIGSLRIDNKPVSTINEMSNLVGTLLQDPDGQFVGLTVAEDLAFKLENDIVEQSMMKQQVKDTAKNVDLENYLNSTPHQLSGGQKQRVTLGGVLIKDLPILLFDEPLANLDPATGKKVMELINTLSENKTTIIVEHRLEDVLHCKIDRIIVMYDGKIVDDDTPSNILATNILFEVGLREPLYITALKYANCQIGNLSHLDTIEQLNIPDLTMQLKHWQYNFYNTKTKALIDPVLQFQNVTFAYIKDTVLNDVSFNIYKGEMISIVGKNGSGKSTIAKLICGFFKPNKGKILLNHKDISNLSIKERSKHIGVVLQNPNQMIFKIMIFDEVAFGLRNRGGLNEEQIKKLVYETLKICGLYKFRNWPISALSFGQKKRVTIASILVMGPQIIILDEPTAGQDFRNYTEIMEFLKTLTSKGITVIIITHDMHLMLEYSDRAIVLADGKKIAQKETVDILTDPHLIEQANLKETSLYQLAVHTGLDDPKEFVRYFIAYDREVRYDDSRIYYY